MAQYQLGEDEKVFDEEASLLYNISFGCLSLGDWQLSSEMWTRLIGLRSSKKERAAKVSDFTVNKSKKEFEESENESSGNCLLGILSFDLSPATSNKKRSADPADKIFALDTDDAKSSTSIAMDLKYKARTVGWRDLTAQILYSHISIFVSLYLA